MLVEILARDSNIPIETVEEGVAIEPNKIFVTPPNCHVEVSEQGFILVTPDKEALPKPNINKLFNSIAHQFGPCGVGIILSGTGSDGVIGVASIRACGGINIAQSPDLCKYQSMPNAAIGTGMVDVVGDMPEIGLALSRIMQETNEEQEKWAANKTFSNILSFIQKETKVDLSGYKKATISRRIQRRLSIQGLKSLDQYLKFLKKTPTEVNSFIQDSFIVVTEFFRDTEAFETLKALIYEAIKNREFGAEIRIWVAGCATGEEAFSLAILMEEYNKTAEYVINYRIFATDISKPAVTKARAAEFSKEHIQNLPSEYLSKYFDKNEKAYVVKRKLRDRVVFSCHNMLSDPPFSNIHLVTCRNVLIYFNDSLQSNLLSTFHFSLVPQGYLFLGSAESISDQSLFVPIDRKMRLYARDNTKETALPMSAINKQYVPIVSKSQEKFVKPSVSSSVYEYVAKTYGPSTIVVNDDDTIIYTFGDVESFLERREGLSTLNILDLIRQDMRAELRALVFKARREVKSVTGSIYEHKDKSGESDSCQVCVSPYANQLSNWLYISFVSKSDEFHSTFIAGKDADSNDERAFNVLKSELNQTRDNLQTVVEELETSNEQLQVYIEELQSSNEEYQSANEELQTVNEELQSTNEELLTVNDELEERTRAQEQLSNDIVNIQDSLEIPMFIVNEDFRIKVFTQRCSMVSNINNLKTNDIVFAIEWYGKIPRFREYLQDVLSSGKVKKFDVEIKEKFYLCQISPYRDQASKIQGLTIIFYETTAFLNTQLALNKEKHIAQATLNSISDGVIRVEESGVIDFMNPAAQRLLQWDRESVKRKHVEEIFKVFADNEPVDVKAIVEVVCQNYTANIPECDHFIMKTRYGQDIVIEFNITSLSDNENNSPSALIVFRDVTERHSQLKQLLWNSKHDPLTGLINRDEIERRIELAIMTARRSHITSTFLYLDLDQFKLVNDTCGHLAGDQLLKQVSEIIISCIRSRDTVARLGGDEFAVLLDKCPLVDSEKTAKKIQTAISDYRFAWEEKLFRIGVSIGMVEINERSVQVSDILSESDGACYSAKEQGRNRIQICGTDNTELEQQKLQMRSISDINEAIENDHFRLYFQKIHCCESGHTLAWEVLIRMFNKRGEFLLPDNFLPAAERFGLINLIDRWVLKNSLRKFSEFAEFGDIDQFPQLNINISGDTVGNETLIKELETGLQEHNIPPEKICFEITETAAIRNFLGAKKFMEAIREMGCKFALDDFGTGTSSLSYLRDLPLDFIKIDKTFINNINNDEINRSIVQSVCDVCTLMEVETIAEGAERQEQFDLLKEMGASAIQGFVIGKPIPVEEFLSQINSDQGSQ
jgi:two-component system CheB/CheR fusion protein